MSDRKPLDPNKFGARLTCTVCGREKLPIGRSAPPELYSSRCSADCGGYYLDPQVGSLWPDESEADFGFSVGITGTETKMNKESSERILRIHRDQGVLGDLMKAFPQHTNAALKQAYYDINFLLEELRKAALPESEAR